LGFHIELSSESPNALIFGQNQLMSGYDIFYQWASYLTTIKNEGGQAGKVAKHIGRKIISEEIRPLGDRVKRIHTDGFIISGKATDQLLGRRYEGGQRDLKIVNSGNVSIKNVMRLESPETIASGVEVPELDLCSICNEEIFLHILKKSFTVLTCGHTVHRLCLENLRETMFTCPVNNCSAEIEIIEKSPLMWAPLQRSMSIDEGSQDLLIFGKNSLVNLDTIVEENSENNSQNKEPGIPDFTTSNLPSKRVGEATSAKSSNKKKKSANREDFPVLKRLIQKLSTNDLRKTVTSQFESTSETNIDSVNFLDLYNKIITSEDINEKVSQD
ncbi:17052_t:CDS:2, partial [Racocetra fulgida]